MQRSLAPVPDFNHLLQQIGNLRRSHALLSLQVDNLASNLRVSQRIVSSERLAVHDQLHEQDSKTVLRTVQFLRIRAKKILLSASPELAKRVPTLCASNSVVQTSLRSSASDCTLYEFQLFAAKVLGDDSIQCYGFPSEYHIQFPNVDSCCRLHIVFATYSDMCQALSIDAATRESGIYREKKTRARNTIAAQVLGVEVSESTNRHRRILLACNDPVEASSSKVSYLYQESPAWFEGSWERGFTLISDSASAIYSTLNQEGGRHSQEDSRPSLENAYLFCVSWERVESDVCRTLTTENVAGALRTHFPAVVLRTQILVSTTRDALKSRNLRQLLSVPQNSASNT